MKICLTFMALMFFGALASATELSILKAHVSPNSHEVSVLMSVQAPPIQTGAVGDQWEVQVQVADANPVNVTVENVTIATTKRGVETVETDEVILKLPDGMSLAGWTSVLVTYKPGGPKTYRFLGTPSDRPKTIVGADSKDDADVYLSGTYSPRIHSPAQYSYDIAVGYGLPYLSQTHPDRGRIGFSITGAADQRPNLDPDSYYAGALWQAYPVRTAFGALQGVVFQLDIGGEFARKKLGDSKTKTSNFLAPSPHFEFPIRLYSGSGVFVTMKPIIGFEYGENFQNEQAPHGTGFLARWLVGTDTVLTCKPKKRFLYSISLSSSWRGRYLQEKEIDTTSVFNPTTQDFDFTFNVTRKPRNHIQSKLDWKWTEFFGLTASHELGAVPPIFNYVDHSVSIGFTFSAAFAKDAVQRRQ
jgi:hypothetical protein